VNKEIDKQLKRLNKLENKILNKKENQLFKTKVGPVIDKIEGIIPEKLKSVLEYAFFKGFQLVFDKGHKYIEKTYNKDKLQLEYDLNNYAVDKKMSKEYMKKLDKQANQSNLLNSAISVVEGGVLGVLGIGLPDIPLFISVIMKNIYEIVLSYGYDYESKEEKFFILLLICGALSEDDKQKKLNEEIDQIGIDMDQQIYAEIDLDEQMKVTSIILSEAMLTAKFIQGIPIVGAIGGVVNYNVIKKIGKYASLKYKKRYLLGKARKRNDTVL